MPQTDLETWNGMLSGCV